MLRYIALERVFQRDVVTVKFLNLLSSLILPYSAREPRKLGITCKAII